MKKEKDLIVNVEGGNIKMVKHEKTKCVKLGYVGYKTKIAKWRCPRCGIVFESGNEDTTEMYCEGHL